MSKRLLSSGLACLLGCAPGANEPCSDAGEASTYEPGVPVPIETTGTWDACAEHPTTDACCCFHGDNGYVYDACPAAFVCPHIDVMCDDLATESCVASIACDEFAAIDCALDALASGTPGALEWRLDYGERREDTRLYMIGDGTAIITTHTNATDYDAETAVVRLNVRPGIFFEDCKHLSAAVDRFDCVQQALTGDVIEMCLPSMGASSPF